MRTFLKAASIIAILLIVAIPFLDALEKSMTRDTAILAALVFIAFVFVYLNTAYTSGAAYHHNI